MFFRKLDDEEIKRFKETARREYRVGQGVDSFWHPVYKRECALMQLEAFDKECIEVQGE